MPVDMALRPSQERNLTRPLTSSPRPSSRPTTNGTHIHNLMQNATSTPLSAAADLSPASPITTPRPFLSLPPEIRSRIYTHALTRDQAFLWPTSDTSYQLTPALLSTCRQIHDEATPFLYTSNRFSFKHPSDCNVFVRIMSRTHTRAIPKVGFHVREKDTPLFVQYFASADPARGLAADLPQLQYVIVFLTQSWPHYRDPDEWVRNWMQNQGIKRICESLKDRTKAEVTVLCSIRVAEQLWGHLRRGYPELLFVLAPGHLRTKPVEFAGARCMMELFCQPQDGPSVGE